MRYPFILDILLNDLHLKRRKHLKMMTRAECFLGLAEQLPEHRPFFVSLAVQCVEKCGCTPALWTVPVLMGIPDGVGL